MLDIKYIARRFERASTNTNTNPHTQTDEVNSNCARFFAGLMASKLHASTRKGRAGWHDRALVSDQELCRMLVDHLSKGNTGTFIDIANFAMMLHLREADPAVLAFVAKGDV